MTAPPDIALDPFDGHYELGELLGSGGMGNVYSAMQVSLGRRVAIKLPQRHLVSNPLVLRRFRAEALAGSRIDHRNVARVMDFGERNGVLFLVMEYLPGVTLDSLLLEHGPMLGSAGPDLCGQLLDGLAAAHSAGVIHADIKSANLIVEMRADGPIAHVIDFGLARFVNAPELEVERLLSGTPEYLAPELITGGLPSVASDLYAAGIVLYELLTGATPFAGGTSDEILRRHSEDAVVPPSLRSPDQGIHAALDAVIIRALAKEPAARFETAASFAAALRACPRTLAVAPRAKRETAPPFSTESPTRDLHPEPPEDVASDTDRIALIRAAITEAFARNDGDLLVTSYLELARALIDDHDLPRAIAELERGLRMLRSTARETASGAWRLQLCLAALYSGTAQPERARNAATLGREDAARAASELGKTRAESLLARLKRSSART
ncbi:MAG TPA: serine/threonine-protein kinase [Kofleriaceae bacterium]|nr:serine/threonine-protein kinase [Kofleriaceae bacterium]